MLNTYQFKTHYMVDGHSSKTVNIILPGLVIKQRWTSLRTQGKSGFNFNCIDFSWNNSSHRIWILYFTVWHYDIYF